MLVRKIWPFYGWLAYALGCLCLCAPAFSMQGSTGSGFDWHHAQGVLFRVESPRPGAAQSLLFGTIHVGKLRQLGLDRDRLRAAVTGKRLLVVEVDAARNPWSKDYDHYRFLAAGTTLPQLIGAPAFRQLAALLPDQKRARLARLKPWVAMTLLEASQTSHTRSVDQVVEDIARNAGMQVVELETMEDQLAALDCVSPREYALVLRERLADPGLIRLENRRALAFYRDGDLSGWLADIDTMRGLDAPARVIEQRAGDCLIEQRNTRWTEELEPLLKRGGCFVAVGAIHLAGNDGLLAELVRHGFRVSAQPWPLKAGPQE